MSSSILVVLSGSFSTNERPVTLESMVIRRIPDNERGFLLSSPISLEYSIEDDGTWKCSELSLRIDGFGRTRLEATSRFFVKFSVLWDEIANEDDTLLTPRAIALKQRMRGIVAEVEEEYFGTITSQEATQTAIAQGIPEEDWKATSHYLPPAYQWA